ncbi:MAG: WYL domain-containing protein [Bacteroidales bacterium]|nr:WYL domain-containing protein [Bacteroidales bacterium]
MKASALLKKYVWLVDTIRRTGRITLREINDRWLLTDMSNDIPFSRTTFRRHRQEVEEMFGILINCDAENRYYIDDPSLMSNDSVPRWMLSTLAVSNIVSEARGLHDRILLESIPSESEQLRMVVEAMQGNLRVAVTYRRYGSSTPQQWTLDPYCIKLFRRRWYLLGRSAKGGFIVLSFDRIMHLDVTDDTFSIDPAFDAQAYFSEYYGVMTDDRLPVQRMVLRAYGNERHAMRDLPIHPSQRELKEGDDYVDFEVRLHPTHDFFAQILSRGRWLKVMSPNSIVHEINQLLHEAVESYK